jgi:hypothetical protein
MIPLPANKHFKTLFTPSHLTYCSSFEFLQLTKILRTFKFLNIFYAVRQAILGSFLYGNASGCGLTQTFTPGMTRLMIDRYVTPSGQLLKIV